MQPGLFFSPRKVNWSSVIQAEFTMPYHYSSIQSSSNIISATYSGESKNCNFSFNLLFSFPEARRSKNVYELVRLQCFNFICFNKSMKCPQCIVRLSLVVLIFIINGSCKCNIHGGIKIMLDVKYILKYFKKKTSMT